MLPRASRRFSIRSRSYGRSALTLRGTLCWLRVALRSCSYCSALCGQSCLAFRTIQAPLNCHRRCGPLRSSDKLLPLTIANVAAPQWAAKEFPDARFCFGFDTLVGLLDSERLGAARSVHFFSKTCGGGRSQERGKLPSQPHIVIDGGVHHKIDCGSDEPDQHFARSRSRRHMVSWRGKRASERLLRSRLPSCQRRPISNSAQE